MSICYESTNFVIPPPPSITKVAFLLRKPNSSSPLLITVSKNETNEVFYHSNVGDNLFPLTASDLNQYFTDHEVLMLRNDFTSFLDIVPMASGNVHAVRNIAVTGEPLNGGFLAFTVGNWETKAVSENYKVALETAIAGFRDIAESVKKFQTDKG